MPSVSEEFGKAVQEIGRPESQDIQDSLQRRIQYSRQIAQILDSSSKDIDEFSNKLDVLFDHLSSTAERGLPRPPSYAEVAKPNNWIEAFTKYIAPALVGITAMVYPGKWGQNYVFFNSMMKSLKEGDEEKWKRSVTEWKLNFEHERQARQDKLNALKVQLDKLLSLQKIRDSKASMQIKRLEEMINAENKALELASRAHSKMIDSAYKLMQLKLREQELGLKAQDIAAKYAAKQAKQEKAPEKEQAKQWDRFMSSVDSYVKSQSQTLFGITPETVARGIRYAMARHQVNIPPNVIARIIHDYTGASQEDIVKAITKIFGDILPKESYAPPGSGAVIKKMPSMEEETPEETAPEPEETTTSIPSPGPEAVIKPESEEDISEMLLRFLREARGRLTK